MVPQDKKEINKKRIAELVEEMVANGIDPKSANAKAISKIARESRNKNTVVKKKEKKNKPLVVVTPPMVDFMGETTKNMYEKSMSGNSRKYAIRAFCLMCMGGSAHEVRDCTCISCPLHKFRLKG